MWTKQNLLLEMALNGVEASPGSALWGRDNSSATLKSRTAVATATGMLAAQIWPSFTILQDAGLCGGALPIIDYAALYEALFSLCAAGDASGVLCSWVETESDLDVALGVLAIMGSVFTLAVMAGGLLYRLSRLLIAKGKQTTDSGEEL